MGQAFDREGNLLGDAYGDTKREVFEKLNTAHPDAERIEIQKMRDQAMKESSARERAIRLLMELVDPGGEDALTRVKVERCVDAIIEAVRSPESEHTRAVQDERRVR